MRQARQWRGQLDHELDDDHHDPGLEHHHDHGSAELDPAQLHDLELVGYVVIVVLAQHADHAERQRRQQLREIAMDRRLPGLATVALLALAAGCDRPNTQGSAYNNSGSSATPGSASPASGGSSPWATPAGSESATAAKTTPATPDTASSSAPPASSSSPADSDAKK